MVEEKGSHERETCREKRDGEGKPPKKDGEGVAHGDVQSESQEPTMVKKNWKIQQFNLAMPQKTMHFGFTMAKNWQTQQFDLAMA